MLTRGQVFPGFVHGGEAAGLGRVLKLLQDRNWTRLSIVARGASMAPVIQDGDRLLLRSKPPRWGDIIVFTRGSRMVVHRLLAFRRRRGRLRCLTRGDNQRGADGWIRREDVVGVVQAWRRNQETLKESVPLRWCRTARSLRQYVLTRV